MLHEAHAILERCKHDFSYLKIDLKLISNDQLTGRQAGSKAVKQVLRHALRISQNSEKTRDGVRSINQEPLSATCLQ